jgi:pimeloyl-ACP methyl ester carboxylesterase
MAREAFPPIGLALALMPWLVRDKFDNLAKAPKLSIPTLVLHGSQDEVVPQKQVSLFLPPSLSPPPNPPSLFLSLFLSLLSMYVGAPLPPPHT